MRPVIVTAILVIAMPVTARNPVPTPAPKTPDAVFTLKQPTRYKLPKPVENMIMYALNTCPERAAGWREDYANIYQRKEDVRAWVAQVLTIVWDSMVTPPPADLTEADMARMETDGGRIMEIKGWIEWNKTGW